MNFSLEVYDGPLEMLIQLLQKHKLNIFDVSIALICDQYMAELDKMRQMDMNITSDFLVMASALLLMKSRALLGTEDEAEEDELTVEQLQERILHYKKIKETAQLLSEFQNASYNNFFKETESLDFGFRPTEHIDTLKLVSALAVVLSRVEEKKPPTHDNFKGIVQREKISLPEKIKDVQRIIYSRKRTSFKSVFDNVKTKYEAITVFLAVLHLVSLDKIRIKETEKDIILCSNGDIDEK